MHLPNMIFHVSELRPETPETPPVPFRCFRGGFASASFAACSLHMGRHASARPLEIIHAYSLFYSPIMIDSVGPGAGWWLDLDKARPTAPLVREVELVHVRVPTALHSPEPEEARPC